MPACGAIWFSVNIMAQGLRKWRLFKEWSGSLRTGIAGVTAEIQGLQEPDTAPEFLI